MSDEVIKSLTIRNNFLFPKLNYVGTELRLKFAASCLKQYKITYSHGKIVNIYIVYEITRITPINGYPTLENCLFGAVKLTKHPDIDKYKYSGYGIGFDRKGKFSLDYGFGQNVLIFGDDMSFSVHANNKTKKLSNAISCNKKQD